MGTEVEKKKSEIVIEKQIKVANNKEGKGKNVEIWVVMWKVMRKTNEKYNRP